jgi:glycerol uptake facilitator-like aquaporin
MPIHPTGSVSIIVAPAAHVPAFIMAQLIGALIAAWFTAWLLPAPAATEAEAVKPACGKRAGVR